MNNDFIGIIYTLRSEAALRELVENRNSASIPFCGRYRLIDFTLSAMVNAGIYDVGVIMERDYQSLLDHLSGGKDWDLSRRSGGLRLLPPFGLPEAHSGSFGGCMEALRSVRSYIEDVPQANIVLSTGDFAANIDLRAAMAQHTATDAEITAVCGDATSAYEHHRFIPDGNGFSTHLLFSDSRRTEGLASTEIYILKKELLLSFMDYCADGGKVHFHRDALAHYLAEGGRVGIYEHRGYFRRIRSVLDYHQASMDLMRPEVMNDLFPADRPIRTKERAEVSTYYAENASVKNSLVADGCYIEGEIENCVIFRGVRVAKGAQLKNCVILQDTVVEADAELRCVIADKDAVISAGCFLAGSERLPVVVPKGVTV